ncbi:WhiB family transcriptional regulator [Rhodococcus koreensis]|uniref:WhiB family transcriptional regulator n=1 Tax=Rhodococcus koreensis TaxID=99653 RepID=UPI00366E4B1B
MVDNLAAIPLRPTGYRNWHGQAQCDPRTADLFFSETDTKSEGAAKRICGRCPVRELCRDYAIDANEAEGIWGGLSLTERKRFKWFRHNRTAS